MSGTRIDFSHNLYVVITGASQGIGKCLAIEIAKKVKSECTLVLIARSLQGLNHTKSNVLEINSNINVKVVEMDLTHPEPEELRKALQPVPCYINSAIIFHNVGQIGELARACALTDLKKWRDYYDLNVFSVAILNSVFMECNQGNFLYVVNITSLVGREPFKNLAMYGTAKAARELYFKVFAIEEPQVNVLNYSPGPVNTLMVEEIIHKATDEDTKTMFVDMKEQGKVLNPIQTVTKLVEILQNGDYQSGDVIDYFDRP